MWRVFCPHSAPQPSMVTSQGPLHAWPGAVLDNTGPSPFYSVRSGCQPTGSHPGDTGPYPGRPWWSRWGALGIWRVGAGDAVRPPHSALDSPAEKDPEWLQ